MYNRYRKEDTGPQWSRFQITGVRFREVSGESYETLHLTEMIESRT